MAREVGTEGQLGGAADVKGVSGTWRELTNNVNGLANNLTSQVRDVVEVTTAVANGDLQRKVTIEAQGEVLALKDTINTMVDQLSTFAAEVTRVAREVGTEGQLGGAADVKGVSGTWRELTNNVNGLANNLTSQVRNIAEVTTAVAEGDFSKKITVEARGEVLELKETINAMVDRLSSFAAEVTRVAREVGSEGALGGQAAVEDVTGRWRELTESVNLMADNLTSQVREVIEVTTAVAQGDFTKKVMVEASGEVLQLKETINTMVDRLDTFAVQVTRVARDVGTEGVLGGQATVEGVAGRWRELTESVNLMADNLTSQVRNIAEVTTAVAEGDFSKKITVEARGEVLELKDTVNTMVDRLSSFAAEVTRVARDVGTEGVLGGQATVEGVAGRWRELTESLNTMAGNLTTQVRGIVKVVTAVAQGDLQQKLTLEARGEVADLAKTINGMVEMLGTFADEVTVVARTVGVEGKLGGQASVPGAEGTWRDLTDNVNELAANLTGQVRAMAEVAESVSSGDLSRSITVEAKGEVALLKDNVNQMIATLGETTRTNEEQDWLKSNLARFVNMLQGQKDLASVAELVLSELAPMVGVQHGVFYMVEGEGEEQALMLRASYAFKERKHLSNRVRPGEGLVGQSVLEKKRILLTNVPGDYIQISSGLGEAPPLNIVVIPVVFQEEVKGVVELASFSRFTEIQLAFLEQFSETLGIVLNSVAASLRTEELLKESQAMGEELQSQQEELEQANKALQSQQEELEQTNEELEEKARVVTEQKEEVEHKNREVDLARQSLQEKAEQLALTSKYKSEFLANMSHELRTPLNSLLILARLLADNPDENLTEKQTEYASTIHTSGSELLALINEILDLSKIESGVMSVDIAQVLFSDLSGWAERSFSQTAEDKGLEFSVVQDEALPRSLDTDRQRLEQVLKNLLSNALKFTDQGSVTLGMSVATSGWSADQEVLIQAETVIAFAVRDTGVGVAPDKQQVIFEAFQQVDGTTSRQYGGTGLGLSISREIARLLGGEIRLESAPGQGSTFTLYLPEHGTRSGERGTGSGGNIDPAAGTDAREPVPEPVPGAGVRRALAAGPDPTELPDELADDRDRIKTGDRVLLIVEDDPAFAKILLEMARARDFKVLLALRGDTGWGLAKKFLPDAVTLDLGLPELSGWAILDRLKHDPQTRHIPVHVISVEDAGKRSMGQGAIAHLVKPASKEAMVEVFDTIAAHIERKVKTMLVVEDHEVERNSIVELVGNGDVEATAVGTGAEALEALGRQRFDCMVLDLGLPDMTGVELIQKIQDDEDLEQLPIIVYTGKELTEKEETELRRVTETIIVKDASSPERLLDETALFLHRVEKDLPEPKRKMIRQVHKHDPTLAGRKVLVVDDDMRNIFAVTSVLEQHQVEVVYTESGRGALEVLERSQDIELILMDIMMPGMDGYEAMGAIRQMDEYASIPIIALTAKAMKGDREKCIEAGASDYVAKPVDPEQLVSLVRVWLYR